MPTILVVEDETVLRSLIESELKKNGYTVVAVEHGQLALAVLENQPIDLILLDLLMPVMNGYDFLTHLRATARFASLPCIVFSNSGQPNDLNRAYQCGANAVLIKADFDPAELVQKVQALLTKGTALEGELAAPQ